MKTLLLLVNLFFFAGIFKAQNTGIGTTTPSAKLHVNGTFKVTDGSQGVGKILTSDAEGLASWQAPPLSTTENYPVVWICCNPWMTKNLDVNTYRNGDPIPHVTDPATWSALTTGAYCYYNNDSVNYAAVYGKLYNWYAINDARGLAPEGWHIPTDFEWTTLSNCLGGDGLAGGPMKETGTTHWTAPNAGANNTTGFTALPGGYRLNTGVFSNIGLWGVWWSSTSFDSTSARYSYTEYNTDNITRTWTNKKLGLSVRCVKD